MEVFNHLDLEKKLGDINNDRHGIYEKKKKFKTPMLK